MPQVVTWRALAARLRYARPGSALHLQMHGDAALWGTEAHLLATAVETLQTLSWQYASVHRDPKKASAPKPPKPIRRPGQKARDDEPGTTHIGSDPIPASQFDDWWEGGGG